jgi:hypothetical protein
MDFDAKKFLSDLQILGKAKQAIMPRVFQTFQNSTPVKSGNAKANTMLVNNQIQANYPYAEVLDKGRHMTNKGMRGSNQAPKGMSQPAIKTMTSEIRNLISRIRGA